MIVETPIFVWRVRCSLTNLASHLVSGEFHVWPFNFESCFFFVISNHRSTGYAWITYKKYPAFRGLASNLQPFFGRKTLPPKLPYFAESWCIHGDLCAHNKNGWHLLLKEIGWNNSSVILFPKNTYGEISLKYFLLRCPTFYKGSPFQLIVEKVTLTDVLVDG